MEERERDCIVIGGGPAGSTVAALLAKRGLDVLLLEAGSHPRRHVGESLLPGIIPILDEMGALEAVEAARFHPKSGSTQWAWGLTPRWDLWFRDTDAYDHAWLVDRSRFDTLLFDAARRAGAEIHDRSVVQQLVWEAGRLRGVAWRSGSVERLDRARVVIDASGQAALVARERGTIEILEGLKHQAAWAHFEGMHHLPPPRENQALFVAGGDHWLWAFPLSDGTTSVGVVWLDGASPKDLEDTIAAHPDLVAVIGDRWRRSSSVRRERDWSYRVTEVAAPGFLLVGDASGFIDPVLSTGVFLSMHAAWHAARTADTVIRGERDETAAGDEYTAHHRALFDDMLRIVRFYYQQNLHVDDYFWESKRILVGPRTELKPQRSFTILTSGLIRNIPFDEASERADERRRATVSREAPELAGDPEHLGFVCIQLEENGAPLWFLIEPRDPSVPAMARTASWDLNCLAPKHGNDALSAPSLEPHMRALEACIRSQDTERGEPLAAFWKRARHAVAEGVRGMEPALRLVRVFGE